MLRGSLPQLLICTQNRQVFAVLHPTPFLRHRTLALEVYQQALLLHHRNVPLRTTPRLSLRRLPKRLRD